MATEQMHDLSLVNPTIRTQKDDKQSAKDMKKKQPVYQEKKIGG